MRLGIVDLGTNSVRFAIYEAESPLRPECLYKQKLMLRPGQGVFKTGQLKKSTVRRLLQAFVRFSEKSKREGVEHILAVGTSALREAKNSPELIRRVEKKTGIRIRVITGRKEAQLIARGVLTFEKPPTGRFALVDIGGGSTEITVGKGHARLRSISLPVGALRLQQLYFPQGNSGPLRTRLSAVLQVEKTTQKMLLRNLGPFRGRVQAGIGSSGTIRAVARLLDRRHARNQWNLNRSRKPRLSFTRHQLRDLVEKMLPLNRTELGRLPGMEVRRLDIIVSGSILLLEIMEFLDIKRIKTTNYALRDGLIMEARSRFKRRKWT